MTFLYVMPAFNLTDIYRLILTYLILYSIVVYLLHFGETSNNNIPNFLVGDLLIFDAFIFLYIDYYILSFLFHTNRIYTYI